MTEELDLEQLDNDLEKENRVEKRIKDLSEKVRLTSEERDEHKRLLQEQVEKTQNLEKERDFLNSFGDSVSKYPDALAHKDAIKDRVLKGYSVDDAIVAVLNQEGKLFKKEPILPPKENPAGGSAVNQSITGGEKKISELSREEKRNKLIDLEASGDISMT